jgi:GNAT superfamily N-acetyltransferase
VFDLGLSARTDIDIRPATRQDVEGIARVSVDTWRTTYGGHLPEGVLSRLRYGGIEARHGRFLGEPHTQHFVAVEPLTQEVVGFVNGGPCRQPRLGFDAEVFELYVQRGFQGRGLGRSLFEIAQSALQDGGRKRLLVWVLASNPNRQFYERLGGRMVARQPVRMGGALLQEVAYGWD